MLRLATTNAAVMMTVWVCLQEMTFPKTASVTNFASPFSIAVMIFLRPVVVVSIDVW